MEISINKYYKIALSVLLALLFWSFLSLNTVNASEYFEDNTSGRTTEINSDDVITPFSRGSCEELVRLGLKSPRSCGFVRGKPKGGQIWLTTKQANCVRRFYETSAAYLVTIPPNWGSGALLAYTAWTTMSACRGL